MRIRQIKPGYWLDKELRRGLSAAAREFYIGLWCLADDDGWLCWDVEVIGAELYPYGIDPDGSLFTSDLVAAREEAVTTWARQLMAMGDRPHLVIHDCGHAQVPNLGAHQHVGGRPVYTVRDAHARGCSRMRADARPGRVGKGRVEVGKGSNPAAASDGAAVSLRESLLAAGMKPEIAGKAS